jgi:hypothetical protein
VKKPLLIYRLLIIIQIFLSACLSNDFTFTSTDWLLHFFAWDRVHSWHNSYWTKVYLQVRTQKVYSNFYKTVACIFFMFQTFNSFVFYLVPVWVLPTDMLTKWLIENCLIYWHCHVTETWSAINVYHFYALTVLIINLNFFNTIFCLPSPLF